MALQDATAVPAQVNFNAVEVLLDPNHFTDRRNSAAQLVKSLDLGKHATTPVIHINTH